MKASIAAAANRRFETARWLPAFVLASLLFVAWTNAAPAQSATSVTVAKPVVKDIDEWDDFIGRFDAVDQIDVRARVSGYLDTVNFVDGAIAGAGDLLFVVDQRPYKAALEQAAADLASANAKEAYAESDLERAVSLEKTGNIAVRNLRPKASGPSGRTGGCQSFSSCTRPCEIGYGIHRNPRAAGRPTFSALGLPGRAHQRK